MAMRHRLGGISDTNTRPRQSYRPIYEDFQPQFESKEEPEAHIVHVHLPGFVKEQVKITFVHSPGVIRVHGQRPLGNYKWSRFNQTFPIQENSDPSKIHGKFKNGILTITIPKQVITQTAAATPIQKPPESKPHKAKEHPTPSEPSLTTPAGPPTNTSSEPKAQKGREGISQTAVASTQSEERRGKTSAQEAAAAAAATAAALASKAERATFPARDEKERDDKNDGRPLGPPKGSAAETKARKDKEDEALPKPISLTQNEKQRDEKRLVPLTSPERGIGEPKSREGDQDDKRGKAFVESVYRKGVEHKDQREANRKPVAEPKNAEKLVETTLHKERETGEKSKDARAIIEILEKEKKKSRGFGKPKEDSMAANAMAAAKQRMKNLGNKMNDEEKKMLINMGVAVLVLLALGASASYSFWSSGKGKN